MNEPAMAKRWENKYKEGGEVKKTEAQKKHDDYIAKYKKLPRDRDWTGKIKGVPDPEWQKQRFLDIISKASLLPESTVYSGYPAYWKEPPSDRDKKSFNKAALAIYRAANKPAIYEVNDPAVFRSLTGQDRPAGALYEVGPNALMVKDYLTETGKNKVDRRLDNIETFPHLFTDTEKKEFGLNLDPTSEDYRSVTKARKNFSERQKADSVISELSHAIQFAGLTPEEKDALHRKFGKEYRKYGPTSIFKYGEGVYGKQLPDVTGEREAHLDIESSIRWLLNNPDFFDFQDESPKKKKTLFQKIKLGLEALFSAQKMQEGDLVRKNIRPRKNQTLPTTTGGNIQESMLSGDYDEMGATDYDKMFLSTAEPDKTSTYISNIDDEERAQQSFDSFLSRLPNISAYKKKKLEEFWVAGGKLEIEIRKEGEMGRTRKKDNKNRASISQKPSALGLEPPRGRMTIFDHKLEEHFIAESSHAIKFARKENESTEDWNSRIININQSARQETKDYGEDTYGFESEGLFFPTGLKYPHYEVKIIDGKEVVVDTAGNEYPDKTPPPLSVRQTLLGGNTWQGVETDWIEYNPETRLGWLGEPLTEEFEAHYVVEDSLDNVYGVADWDGRVDKP